MILRNIVILLAIVGVIGGVWWLSQPQETIEPQQEQGEAGSLPYEKVAEGRRYTEETDLYTIEITYPEAPNSAIQARVDEIVIEEVERFKNEIAGLIGEQEAARIREQGRPYTLIIEHKTHYSRGARVSYEFDIYLDTGGAHPNAFYRTVTFDAAGSELSLESLFVEGAPYLTHLSEEAYPRVLEMLKTRTGGEVTSEMEDTVRLGTAPSPEALQFFYLEDGALHLLFPPYQVAAYAAGSFDVAIPLSELEDILRPEIR